MRRGASIGIGVALLASPVYAQFAEIRTPGGTVEASFEVADPKEVGGLISNACIDLGWSVPRRDEFQVECRNDSYGVFYNRFTRLQDVLIFNMVENDGTVRVRGKSTLETTNGFGQMSASDTSVNDQRMLRLLGKAGGRYPSGTQIEDYGIGVNLLPGDMWPFVVEHVVPGGRAARSGLQVGDRIDKVNGKGFSDKQGLKNRVAKFAPPGTPLSLSIKRGEQKLVLQEPAS